MSHDFFFTDPRPNCFLAKIEENHFTGLIVFPEKLLEISHLNLVASYKQYPCYMTFYECNMIDRSERPRASPTSTSMTDI